MIVIEPPSTGSGAGAFKALRKPEIARFVNRARRLANITGEVNLLLADNARLQALNKQFRRKNKATDVLSFPAAHNAEGLAGDLAISVDLAAQQAAEYGHSLKLELQILVLHGLLHLAGYDHEADNGEMRSLEAELQAQLKLPTALIERASPSGKRQAAPRRAVQRKPAPTRSASRTVVTSER